MIWDVSFAYFPLSLQSFHFSAREAGEYVYRQPVSLSLVSMRLRLGSDPKRVLCFGWGLEGGRQAAAGACREAHLEKRVPKGFFGCPHRRTLLGSR